MLYSKELCMEALENLVDNSNDMLLIADDINLLYEVIDDYYKNGESEMVDHPPHYNSGKYETIDEMLLLFGEEEVKAFCRLNAYKYFRRAQFKGNPEEDTRKAEWYLSYLDDLLSVE